MPCPEQLTPNDLAFRLEQTQAVLSLLEPDELPAGHGHPPPAADPPGEVPAFLLFTSGTEGPPKAVVHRRSYVAANRLQAVRWMGVRPGDRIWCTAAGGWSKALRNVWLAAELCDAETVIHPGRFDAAERLDLIARLRPQVLCMSPTEYRLCARSERFGSHDLSAVREAVAAGEALDAATTERWREAYGVVIRDGFGQTETGAIAGVTVGGSAPPGSMGRALPGVEIEIRDGELCVVADTLPTLCAGYWRDGRVEAAALHNGLWHTGDLVQRDDAGLLWYRGRRDDVITSSGYRIGPAEVEAALAAHPAVLEAAAVGLPDPDRGSIVHADVVLCPGVQEHSGLADELREHVRSETAPYKYPRSLRFVEALPRTATGKVRRAAIRGDLVQHLRH